MPPFLIPGTPRSRTAWLARLLSFDGWKCLHEPSADFRSLGDLTTLLNTPQRGASDSLMTLLWDDILERRPDVRVVVVRRPVADVVASFRGLGQPDNPAASALMEKIDAQAVRISAHPGVLTVAFSDLAHAGACQAISLQTLGRTLPPARLAYFQRRNIQAPLPEVAARIGRNTDGFRHVFGQHLAPIS